MDCTVTGGTDPGLDSITCENSEADLTTGVSFADSFVAKVTTNDSVNLSDDNGSAPYLSIDDWVNFENSYRGWGQDGDAFPSTTHRGYADSTETLRIWDWSLDEADPELALLGALSEPSASDTLTHTWSDASTTQLLKNAVEIMEDGVGNDNGLCEAAEDCIFTPNIGSYQGHGSLVFLTPVGDINLYQYSIQWR